MKILLPVCVLAILVCLGVVVITLISTKKKNGKD